MQDEREGGCQCGQIRYRLEGAPIALTICHCRECQRQSGSAFGMSLIVPEESFRLVAGEPKSFTRDADSGSTETCHFCGSCGTRLYHDPKARPGSVNIKPGTLDDTSWLTPNLHVWTRSKQPWVPIPEGLPCFESQP